MLTNIQCNFDFSICITFYCFVCHAFRWSCVIYAHAQSIEHDKRLKGGVSRDRNQQLSSSAAAGLCRSTCLAMLSRSWLSWTLLVAIPLCFVHQSPSCAAVDVLVPGFRPPSVPLVVINPYVRYSILSLFQ